MKILVAFLVIALGLAQAVPGQTGSSSSDGVSSDAVLAVHFRGLVLPSGQMWYELDPGPIATRAIRMYSEPSHTRLAMVVDPEFKNSAAGKAWMDSLPADRIQEVAFSTGSLPDAHPRFQISAPPGSDWWVSVWVNGNYFGLDEDRLVAKQALMGEMNFGSSVYITPEGVIERCCDCHNGTKSCDYCDSNQFYNCCYFQGGCQIYCPAQICGQSQGH
jgi:hypothetical protein